MCDPISLGSLAVGAAGSAINGYEASQNAAAQINARNAATQQEMERQKAYGEKTRGDFNKSLDIYSPGAQTQGLSDAQSTFGDVLTRNTPTNVGSITTTGAPRVVGDSENSRLAGVFQTAADRNTNLANLKGYDQQQFGNKIALNSNARDIDMTGDFAKVSSGVSGIEGRAAANNATRSPSGLGSLLQFAGTVGANQAGRGKLSLPTIGTGYAGPYI
jgi:hypothetical protein